MEPSCLIICFVLSELIPCNLYGLEMRSRMTVIVEETSHFTCDLSKGVERI